MNIRKRLPIQQPIPAFAIAVALTLPCAVQAVGIGEIVLQSRLGEPLLAQVDLIAGSGEHIEDSCLSLAAPDPHEDPSGYLTQANLAIKTEGQRQYVAISSRKPLNDAFARLRLQVKCPGTGNVIKTLTILPDLNAAVPLAPVTAPSAPAEAESTSAPPPSGAHDITPAANQHDTRSSQPDTEKHLSGKAARPVNKQHPPPAQTTGKKPGRSPSFRLKLSGDLIDESRIGKISAEERAVLLAQKKLIDADDQMASFLALQHQVKQLQDELGEIKLQLAQLSTIPSAAASSVASSASAPAASPATATTGAQESRTKPAIAVKQPAAKQTHPDLLNGLFAALGVVLAILALWLGLRYYTSIKSRARIKSQLRAEPLLKPADDLAAAAQMAPPLAARPPSRTSSDHAPAVVAPPRASTARNEAVSHLPPQEIEAEVTEEDSMLEEAGLYAAHGRMAKAIEILQEITRRSPAKADAWALLLSIYSSLGNAAEFEQTARKFLRHHKGSPSWSGIQALGRTLDQDNPLYADHNGRISAAPLLPDALNPRRQIGDILMGMGLLSKQDLQNCLDDFDPKKHGRFGGYLVARKVITLAQLDQALLQQQGINTEAKPGALPSLQDMENFLADFDPKRDGSVGEFLASRKAGTPEQLSQLLQQQTVHEEAATEPPQAGEPPPSDKVSALDFVLDSTPARPVFDLEFEPSTGGNKPLDFEVEAPSLAFPEINLDLDLKNDKPAGKKPDTQ